MISPSPPFRAGGPPDRLRQPPACLVATLGTEPQVITLALQALEHTGETIERILVIHTAPREPRIAEAIRVLDSAFAPGGALAARQRLYRRAEIVGPAGPVPDVLAVEDFGATLALLYREVRDLKQAGWRVHLNVAGGRKVMSLCGVTVAQLLFDDADRLWYLQSPPDLVASRALFAADPSQLVLVSLPVLRWSPAPPILTDVALADDPVAAITLARGRRDAVRRAFLERELTPAEREVAELAIRTGATDRELASLLHKSPRTVAHQLSVVYDKLRVFLGVRADVRVDRHTLMAEFAAVVAMGR